MIAFWEFCHNLGFHFYTLPMFACGAVSIVMAAVHHHNQKKRDKDFEKEMDQWLNEPDGGTQTQRT